VVRAKDMTTTLTTAPKKRTTLDLPPALLQRTDEAVKLGIASSRNNLKTQAEKGLDLSSTLFRSWTP